MLFGSSHMGMHLKASTSYLTYLKEALLGKNRTIAFIDVVPPPNPIQCHPCIFNNDMTYNLYTLLKKALEIYLSKI